MPTAADGNPHLSVGSLPLLRVDESEDSNWTAVSSTRKQGERVAVASAQPW